MDKRLCFDVHISTLRFKLSKIIGIIYKLKEYVPQKILINLYYTFVYLYLIDRNIIWGGTFDVYVNQVVRFRKR